MKTSRSKTAKALILLPLLAGFVCACLVTQSANVRGDDDPPKKKLTIKQIMKEAHKDGLIKKVATGKSTEKETKRLHKLYTEMAKLPAPKGDKKSWDEKNKALVTAAKAAVDKDAGFKAKLKTASNCSACHKIHKP